MVKPRDPSKPQRNMSIGVFHNDLSSPHLRIRVYLASFITFITYQSKCIWRGGRKGESEKKDAGPFSPFIFYKCTPRIIVNHRKMRERWRKELSKVPLLSAPIVKMGLSSWMFEIDKSWTWTCTPCHWLKTALSTSPGIIYKFVKD